MSRYRPLLAQSCIGCCHGCKSGVRENKEVEAEREWVFLSPQVAAALTILGVSTLLTQSLGQLPFLECDIVPELWGQESSPSINSGSDHRCTEEMMNLKSGFICFLLLIQGISVLKINSLWDQSFAKSSVIFDTLGMSATFSGPIFGA